jgi:hypothetical protein
MRLDVFGSISDIIDHFINDKIYETPTKLCETFTRYGSDKGDNHNYSTLYNHLFASLKDDPINLFEVGLGTGNLSIPSNMGVNAKPGASHIAFAEYFSNGMIFGADVDKGCLIQTDRIKTFFVDQTNPYTISNLWNNPEMRNIQFDILIDDGLHQFNANKMFFEHSIHKLKDGGIYIVEDILNTYLPFFQEWIDEIKATNSFQYVEMITLQHPNRPHGPMVGSDDDILDNRLMIIVK